ncbi:MAG: preprotein translocase subunit YajC [Acidimicrobiia bacterium]
MEFAIAWFVLLAAVFFFLVVRPQRRQIAAHRALVSRLQVGDEVITAGGLYGTIRALRDETIELEVADGVVVRMARGAIARAVELPTTTDDEVA